MSKRIAMRAATLSIAAAGAVGIFASGAFASGARNIVEGDTGPDVVCVQQAMNNLDGAGLATDGDFGPLTKAAVENFQSAAGDLGVDGQVGPDTGGAIKEQETNHDIGQTREGDPDNAYAQWLDNCSSLLEG